MAVINQEMTAVDSMFRLNRGWDSTKLDVPTPESEILKAYLDHNDEPLIDYLRGYLVTEEVDQYYDSGRWYVQVDYERVRSYVEVPEDNVTLLARAMDTLIDAVQGCIQETEYFDEEVRDIRRVVEQIVDDGKPTLFLSIYPNGAPPYTNRTLT